MTVVLETSPQAAARDTRVEALLDLWELPYELEPEFDLAKIKQRADVQARLGEHMAPAAEVERYATHMQHGAVFPPLVLTSSGELVDGSTRVGALRKIKATAFPVYKVKFGNLAQARLFAAALNQQNGRALTSEEVIAAAEGYLSAGYADEAIARELGVSVTHVRNVRREREFRQKAERVGMSELNVPKQAQRTLAGIAHDEPFKAAAELVAKAAPPAKDVTKLVDAVSTATSDADAVATVRTYREEWAPSGPPPQKRATSVKAVRACKAAAALAELVTGDVAELVPGDETKRAKCFESWRACEKAVVQVVAAFQTANQK